MKPDSVVELVTKELHPMWRTENERVERIDKWQGGHNEDIELPRETTREHRQLRRLAQSPWLRLVTKAVVQGMYVDSYRSPLHPPGKDGDALSGPWWTWCANRMPVRQIALHRAMVSFGLAYTMVLPGELRGRRTAAITVHSPKRMIAGYKDPGNDDFPMYALGVEPSGGKQMLQFVDEMDVHYLSCDSDGSKVEYIEHRGEHGLGLCPVIRYANELDTEGNATGEVEPYIGSAARIDKTTYDRLLAQHYNSWKIRTATGMAKPDSDEEENKAAMLLRHGDLLVNENPEGRFGTLDETDISPMVAAWRADVEALAAVSQTPAHELTGQLVNLSAEALAAARAGLRAKTAESKVSAGASHVQTLRTAALIEGNDADAEDMLARVTWQDTEVRSLAQASDALGKAATMLQIPVQALWGMLPGVEKSDVDEWVKLMRPGALEQLREELARQARGELDPPADPDEE
ncbi:phage portal protein [Lentzea chajnantorensis]